MGRCCARFAVPLLNSLQKTVVVAHIGFPPSLALTTFEQELEVSLAASTPSLPPFALVGHSNIWICAIIHPFPALQHRQARTMAPHHLKTEELPNSPQEKNEQRL